MKRRLRLLLIALPLAGAAAALASGFDLEARLGLQGAPEGDLELYGNVDIRQVELGFRVAGRVAEMRFEEGDPVREGDLLARLDRRPYQDRLRLAAAEVARERANLEMMQAGTRPEEIAQAQAVVAERRAKRANAIGKEEGQEKVKARVD